MFMAIVRGFRGGVPSALFCLAAGLLLSGPATAQAPRGRDNDLLDQERRREEVAAQRVEAEIRQTLRDAQNLARTSPEKAADRLKGAVASLEEDTVLKPGKRDALKRMLKDRIRVLGAATDQAEQRDTEKADRKAREDRRKAVEVERAAEDEKVSRLLDTVKNLRNLGKHAEADRLAADVARQYPNNAAAQAARRVTSAAGQLQESGRLRQEREQGFRGAVAGIDRSAVPPSGDLEFPKHWKELTERRRKITAIPMTAKERAIIQTLSSPISASFKESRFEDVIQYLQTLTGQAIIVDKLGMDDVQVTYETPITLSLKGVATRTLLRRILADVGLTYVVKDEAIQVTSVERAKGMMTARAYYMGDLVGALNVNLPPFLNQLQVMQNAALIVDMIQNSIEPETWQSRGGAGTIVFEPRTLSIIVKQSAEIHYMLGGIR